MYYLRTKPAANPIQFTVDKTKLQKSTPVKEENGQNGKEEWSDNTADEMAEIVCSLDNKEACLSCGS